MKRRAEQPLINPRPIKKKRLQAKNWVITLNTTSSKYLNKLQEYASVEYVEIAGLGYRRQPGSEVYLVRTSRRVFDSHFKGIPYLGNVEICPWTVEPPNEESTEETLSLEDSSSDDSFEQQERKYKVYQRVLGMTPKQLDSKLKRDYIKREREADARLRRELEQIEISMMLGISCDTPDEVSKYKPEKRFWQPDVKDPLDDLLCDLTDPTLILIRKDLKTVNEQLENEYFAHEQLFWKKYPEYNPY